MEIHITYKEGQRIYRSERHGEGKERKKEKLDFADNSLNINEPVENYWEHLIALLTL